MPPEVLFIIFSFLPASTDFHQLTLVCKSWKEVAETIIYSDISFPNKGYRLLLDNAQHRWRYPNSLKMVFFPESDQDSYICLLEEARNQGSPIRRAALESGRFLDNQELFGRLSEFPLSCLDLSGLHCGISLSDVLTYFDLPTLRDLRLGRLTWSKTVNSALEHILYDSPWERFDVTLEREPNHPVSQHCQEKVFPRSRHRRGNLQKLSLVAPAVGPDVVNLLFSWPARLREVIFSCFFDSICGEDYTSLAIEKLLDIHRSSLEKIEIPALPENGLPNFSLFCELHHLHIHASSLFCKSPYDAWARLQTPRLRHLTITLASEEESASSDDFGHAEAEWLKALLLMIQSAPSPQNSLSEISLNFAHDNASPPSKGMWLAELWDTANVDEVAAMAASFGISLTYNKPLFDDGLPCLMGAMNRKSCMVYELLLEVLGQGIYQGLRIEQLADRLDLPVEDVSFELQWLQDWSFVFTTVDDSTFSPLLYD